MSRRVLNPAANPIDEIRAQVATEFRSENNAVRATDPEAYARHIQQIRSTRHGAGNYADPKKVQLAQKLRRDGLSVRAIQRKTRLSRETLCRYVSWVSRSDGLRNTWARKHALQGLTPGLRVGSLVLVRPDTRQGKWICRCKCGATVFWPKAFLAEALAAEKRASCRACFYRASQQRYYIERMRTCGTLWLGDEETQLEQEIRDALESYGHAPPGAVMSAADCGVDPEWPYSETTADVYHPDGLSQVEIAQTEGVTRQRIQQIEVAAGRKIRERFDDCLEPRTHEAAEFMRRSR